MAELPPFAPAAGESARDCDSSHGQLQVHELAAERERLLPNALLLPWCFQHAYFRGGPLKVAILARKNLNRQHIF